MKKSRERIAALAFAVLFIATSWGQEAQRVLMVPREHGAASDFIIEHEALVIKQILSDAGYDVEVATQSGNPLRRNSLVFPVDFKVSDIDLSRYRGVMFICEHKRMA